MAMMACFALYRLDERAFVLLPGNLAVFIGLAGGALSLALKRRGWLPVSLAGAALTAALGLYSLSLAGRPLSWMRLPGSPVIWLVIGLYCAFRLGLIYQNEVRKQTAQRQDKLRERLDQEGEQAEPATPASGRQAQASGQAHEQSGEQAS